METKANCGINQRSEPAAGKRSKRFWSFIYFATVVAMALPSVSNAADVYVYRGGGCTGKDRLATFEKYIGRPVDGVVDFAANQNWTDMLNATQWLAGCWVTTGRKLSLSISMLPSDPSTTMEKGAAGEYDKYFAELAKRLVAGGFPNASIRIGWEFNGNYFRWGAPQNSGAVYSAYFRKIVAALRSAPGQSFKMVWNPAIGVTNIKLEDYYPGDDVVDIIAMDIYNQSWRPQDVDFAVRWKYFEDQPYGLNWMARFAAQHKKPMALPEWGTGTRPDGHGFGDDPAFIEKMADWIEANNVAFHGYWDYPASDYNAQISDGSKPAAGEAFKRRFGKN